MDQKTNQIVYTPEPELKYPLRLISKMVNDLVHSYELAWRLFIKNISARYRQTIIGYFWAVLPPLLTSAIWIFLNSQKILSIKETSVPYPLYIIVGTILWQVFTNSINSPIRVVKSSAIMISKINFPREALIFAAFFEILFSLFIQFWLLVMVFFYFNLNFSLPMLLGVLGVLGIIMMGMIVGILLTPISMLYGDVQQGLPMILQPMFYLTPIVYVPPKTGVGAIIAMYNPMSPLIQFTRELLITGNIICIDSSIIVLAFSGLLLLLGWLIYRISMPHLIERIAA